MRGNYGLKFVKPPVGLFDRIIFTIKREKELQHTRRLLFSFLTLSLISIVAAPFSWIALAKQAESSGVLYFISIAVGDLGTFFALWRNFGLAILESLPIIGIIVFAMNVALILFTIRLFIYKKRLLLKYLINSFNLGTAFR